MLNRKGCKWGMAQYSYMSRANLIFLLRCVVLLGALCFSFFPEARVELCCGNVITVHGRLMDWSAREL